MGRGTDLTFTAFVLSLIIVIMYLTMSPLCGITLVVLTVVLYNLSWYSAKVLRFSELFRLFLLPI